MKEYTGTQLQAKELGIKNWHMKKEASLVKEIKQHQSALKQRAGKSADVPQVSYGQLLDILDTYAINNLTSAFEALDKLSKKYYRETVELFDRFLNSYPAPASEQDLDFLYALLNQGLKNRITIDQFYEFLIAVCSIYAGKGWAVNVPQNKLYMPQPPTFRLGWHIDLWSKQSKDRSAVYRILAILTSPETE